MQLPHEPDLASAGSGSFFVTGCPLKDLKMQRRSFLKAGGAITLAAGFGADSLLAHVPTHNFDKYDFGSGPPVADRLYQGPFSADDYPSWNVVMALTPSREVVPNYGMGLITYVCDEVGPAHKDGEALAQSIENLVKLPLGTKLYLRVNWKDVQQRPGKARSLRALEGDV